MKLWNHLRTITRHRHAVIRHCFKAGIGWQGLRHDLSKYSPTELFRGARFYQGTRSPNDAEREAVGYSLAWMHHKGRNKHHHEYWTDYSRETHRVEPVKMPLKYLIEMFCDRVAACKIYQGKNYPDGAPLAYYHRGRGKQIMHPETGAFLEKLLVMLEQEGEDAAFAWIRDYRRTHDDY